MVNRISPISLFDLYESYFDSHRAEHIPTDHDERVEDIIDYCGSVFNREITIEQARTVADADKALDDANHKNDDWIGNHWNIVYVPLSDIDI